MNTTHTTNRILRPIWNWVAHGLVHLGRSAAPITSHPESPARHGRGMPPHTNNHWLTPLVVAGLVWAAGTNNAQAWWTYLLNQGAPAASYYLGDKVQYVFNFAVNQDTSPMTVSYGIGTTQNGSGWTWRAAEWSYQSGSDRYWKSKANEHQFTSTGNWYYSGRFVWTANGYTEYASGGWAENRTSLSAGSYFSVSSLTAPTLGTVSATASSVTLNWTKWNTKDVMIVRSTDSSFTAPTGGTTYTPGTSYIGGDLVVYRGSATSFEDTGLSSGTTYYYALYSENWSYYSAAATTSKITIPAQPGTITGDATVCSGASGKTYSISSVTGATGYTWSVPSGASITAGSGTTSITVTFGSSSGNISVTANNASGSSTARTLAVTVNSAPAQPGTITGNASVCPGASGETYSISAVSGATGYTWTVPTGASITSGSGTTSITVTFGTSSGNVSVTADNSCGSSTARTLAVAIRPNDATWDGGGGTDNNTLTEANWSTDLHPCPSSSAGIMRFAGSADTPYVNHTANSDWYAIYFNSGAGAFTLSGNALDIFSRIQNDSSSLQTVNNNLVLGAATEFYANSGNLTLGGTLANGGYTLTVRSGASRTTTLSGKISGTGDLAKSGHAGTVKLTAANDYTGATTVGNTGILEISNSSALGTTAGSTTVSSGGTLALSGNINTPEAITARGAGYSTGGAIRNLSGNNTISGKVTVNTTDNTRIHSDSGTLTLDVASGNALESTMSLIFYGDGDISINDPITVAVGKSVTKDGSGTLVLAGTSTYGVNTTVSAGTLLVSGAIGSSAVALNGGTLAGAGTVGALTMAAGTIVSPGNTASTKGTLTVNGAASLAGAYTCDITGLGGTDCDLISASGAVSATAALVINLPGTAPTGFDQGSCYTWTIASGSSASAANMSIGTKWTSTGTFAVEASGNTIVVTHKPPVPSAPTANAATSVTTSGFQANWSAASGATGYRLDVATDSGFTSMVSGYNNLDVGNVVLKAVSGLSAGTTYYYRLRVYNCAGTSGNSGTITVKTICAAPTGVSATDGTLTTGVTVTWNAATGATSYQVVRNTSDSTSGATDLGTQSSGFDDTTADPGVLYYYFVRAYNGSAYGAYSTSDSGYRKLAAPTGVAATDGTLATGVTVTWNAVTGADSYTVYRNTTDSTTGGTDLGTQSSGFNDTTAVPGTLYYYFVRAVDSAPSHTSDYSSSNTGYRQLSPPANVAASDGSSTAQVTVTWDAATGATSYKVFRSAAETETHTGQTDLGTQTSPFNDTGAAPGQKYWYWVKAVDSSPAHESDYSSANDGYRKLATVTITDASDNLGDKVTITWTDITGETGYSVWRWTSDSSGSAVCIATPATLGAGSTTFDDTTAVPGVPYYYWVRGTNSTSSSQGDFQANGSPGQRVAADKGIWDAGGGADGKWSTAVNWSGDQVPGTDTNIVFYSAVSATAINVDSPRTILGLRFNELADSALTFSGSALTIDGGGIDMDAAAAGAHTLGVNVVLNANQNWTNASSANLTVSGAVSGSGTLTKMGTGRIILSGNNSYTAATAIDAGTLRIQHANALGGTGAGTTVATDGALEIQGGITTAAEALTLNGTGVSGGGALRNTANDNTYAGAITLGSASRINSDSGTLTLNVAAGNAIAGAYNLTLGGAGNITVSDPIATGAGTLTKDGTGTLTLSAANTFEGNTRVAAGTLAVNHLNALERSILDMNGADAGTVTFGAASSTYTLGGLMGSRNINMNGKTLNLNYWDTTTIYSGQLSNGSIVKKGEGTLTLSGQNTYTGTTKIETGALQAGVNNALSDSTAVTIESDGTYDLNDFSDTVGSIAGAGQITLGSGALTAGGDNSSTEFSGVISETGSFTKTGTGKLTLSGANTHSGGTTISGGTLQIGNNGTSGSIAGNIANNSALIFHRSDDLSYGGAITGTGTLEKKGAGRLSLSSGSSSYSGVTTITEGAIRVSNNNALGTAAGGTVVASGAALELASHMMTIADPLFLNGAGGSFGGALVNVSQQNTASGAITLQSDSTIKVTTGILNLTGGLGGAYDLTFDVGQTCNMNSVVSQVTSITKTGSGTLSLSQANTYAGPVQISAGVVSVAHASALGTTAAGTTVANGAQLKLSGAGTADALTLTGSGPDSKGALYNAGGENTVSGAITLGGATRINSDSSTLTVSGGISGSYDLTFGGASGITVSSVIGTGTGKVTMDGTGTLTLSAANTFSGGVSLGSGTLNINHAQALGTVAGTFTIGGGTIDNTSAADVTTLNHPMVWNGDFAFTGTKNLDLGTGNTTLGASPTVTVNAGTLTVGGAISGAGYGLTKAGAGTLVLGGASSYSGATTISAGTLVMSGSANNSACSVASGATLMGDGSVGGLTVTGSVKPGNTAGSLGSLGVSSLTTVSGAKLYFQIGDCTDTSERDYISNSGSASIAATTTVYLDDDLVENWNNANSYSWNLIVGGITDASNFTLDESLWALDKADGTFCLSASGNNLVLTFTPQPATQAHTITFSNVGKTSMVVSWTLGNGDGRLVIAREGSAPSSGPADGTTYTADADFSASPGGSTLGGGKVVYVGSGSSFTLSGLSQNTTYYLQVFEYSGSGSCINYYSATASDNPNSQLTAADTAPDGQATDLSVTAFGTTTLSLGWSRGNGDKVLIVGREASAAEEPTDGATYSANAAWGSAGTVGSASKAVYAGTGESVDLTGLTPATLYHFAAFEYFEYSGNEMYNRTDEPVVSRYTLSTEPANHVTSFNANDGDPAASTLNLTWVASSGTPAPDGYLVVRRVGTYPTGAPEDGRGYAVGNAIGDGVVAAIVTPGTATSKTISGLAANTAYYFKIFPFCSNGVSEATFNYKTDGTWTETVNQDWEDTATLNVIKDQFNYTGNLSGQNGADTYSTGWNGAWSVTYPGSYQPTLVSGSKNSPVGYPAEAVNKVQMSATDSESDIFTARRTFPAFTSGKIYASALMSFNKNGTGRYCGLSLIDTTDASPERAFLGAAQGYGEVLTLASHGAAAVSCGETFWGGNEKTHLVIIRYDFDTKKISGLIYRYDSGNNVPTSEPETWHINNVDITGRIDADGINAVQFTCGGKGDIFQFDEVRVADSWAALVEAGGSASTETPTVQAANLNVASSTIATNKFTLTLTGGNGNNVLVVASKSAITWTPADDATYTANAAYGTAGTEVATGSGVYAIYNGADANPTINLIALEPNTIYHFRAFEYNEEGVNFRYLTVPASANPYSRSTLGPPIPAIGMAGTTAVNLNWTRFESNNEPFAVLVAYRVGQAVTFTPTDGTSYSAGVQPNGDTILLADEYNNTYHYHSGLTEGTTVHYKFFTRNFNYYSEGVSRSVTLIKTSMILYENFYDSSGNLDDDSTPSGSGWDSYPPATWQVEDSYGTGTPEDAAQYNSGSLPGVGFAQAYDNKAIFYGANDGRAIVAERWFSANKISNGTYYLSWRMNTQWGGDYNWAGVELVSQSGTVEAFIGNPYGYSTKLGVDIDGTVTTNTMDYHLYNGSENDYIVVAKLELNSSGNDVLRVHAYKSGSQLPAEEPTEWALSVNTSISDIARLRLKCGASGANQIGLTYFDEIRMSQYWTATMREDGEQYMEMLEDGPTPELIYVGSGYSTEADKKITSTDAELTNDLAKIDIAVRWTSPYGVFLTNTVSSNNVEPAAFLSSAGNVVPNWDPLAKVDGVSYPLGFDNLFTGFIGSNGAVSVTSYYANAFTGDDFNSEGASWSVGDEFFITVSGQTYPSTGAKVAAPASSTAEQVPVRRALTINTNLQFYVVDDDPNPPMLRGFDTVNPTDQQMLEGFNLAGEVQDTYSGVQLSSLKFWLTNSLGTAVYSDQAFSTKPAKDGDAQQDWGGLGHPISVAWENNSTSLWKMTVTASDMDDDNWEGDRGTTNKHFEFTVVDDDEGAPILQDLSIKGLSAQNRYTDSGEVLFYDFGTTEPANLQPERIFPSLSVADLTKAGAEPDTSISGNPSGLAVYDNNWNTTDNYWEWVVSVQEGFKLKLLSIGFDSKRSGVNSPTGWQLKSSADGYNSVLASGELSAGTTYETIAPVSFTDTDHQDTVTYRLYGTGAGDNNATWRLDNVVFNGKVSTVAGTFLATDGDLYNSTLVVSNKVQDVYSGIYAINHAEYAPACNLIAPGSETPISGTFKSGPTGTPATNTLHELITSNGVPYADIVLGTWTSVVSVVDRDNDRPNDRLTHALTNKITVVDDDVDPPRISNLRGTYVTFDGKSAGSIANAVTDGDLVDGLTITNRLYDEDSGILQSSVQFRIQDPDGWDSDRVNFSTRPADGGARTNKFNTSGTTISIENYDVKLNENGGRALGVWTCSFYAVDYDIDRPGDGLGTTQTITMVVIDDDTYGPRMSNVQSPGVSAAALIATGFETYDGWPSGGITEGDWNHAANDGTWSAISTYIQTINGRGTDRTTNTYNAGFNAANDSLQLPAVDKPGWVTVWAKLSGTGETKWALDRKDGETWISLGERSVTSTDYAEFSWLVDSTNTGVQLRLRLTQQVTGTRSIYFDDLVVTPYRPWTNTAVSVTWEAGTDEWTGNSGLGGYRMVPLGSNAPTYSTNGLWLASSASGTSFEPSQEIQGVVTGYVFAVDDDDDRGDRDRAAGLAIPTIARLDIVKPTHVPGVTAANSADDPSTQFDLAWTATSVGPDDSGDTDHYPSWGQGNNFLSPWQSYKIYYSPWDPLSDPGEKPADVYINQDVVGTGMYTGWPSVSHTNPIADPSAAGFQPNYLALTNAARNSIRLYDLEPGEDYIVVIVGVDQAGNEGPANGYSWATNDTIKFVVTSAWTVAKSYARSKFGEVGALTNVPTASNATALAWLAAGQKDGTGTVTKVYDLIYWDSSRFQETATAQWKLIGNIKSNWFVDDGNMFKDRGSIRFYRASYKDRWRTNVNGNVQRPLASEEVYAQHNVVLSRGNNYVALHGVPWTNTFEAVFGGTNVFPAGTSGSPGSGSTVVEFYTSDTNALSFEQYWLNSADGHWWKWGDGDVHTDLQASNFFSRGFSITLPDPIPDQYVTTTALDYNELDPSGDPIVLPAMVWSPVLQVPTNDVGFSQTIHCGQQVGRVGTNVYNLVALRLPVYAHPSELNLIESGFVKGLPGQSDEIYTLNTRIKDTRDGSTIYCDPSGTWRFVKGNGLISTTFLRPNDIIVIISRNWVGNGTWTWTYHPTNFYRLPDKWMGH